MFDRSLAARFSAGNLSSVSDIDRVGLDDVVGLAHQKQLAMQNVTAFLAGRPCLDMLLWGNRGGGKSTLIKMLLTTYSSRGLRVIEYDPAAINELAVLYARLRMIPNLHFLISFDDISFDSSDVTFRRFKSVIEGGIEKRPDNVMFVASSNKRFLVKRDARTTETALFENDEVSEETSLAARFGLQLGFYPLKKDEFLDVVQHYLEKYGMNAGADWQAEAEAFAIDRGGRSGRVARQFAAWVNVRGTKAD